MTKEDNASSKLLLLDCMDMGILGVMANGVEFDFKGGTVIVEADPGLINSMIMNRNRVARFFGLPTRDFKEEKRHLCQTHS